MASRRSHFKHSPHTELSVQRIDVSKLFLDPQNPRLRDSAVDDDPSQKEMTQALWEDMAVDELIYSIAENGFLPYEPLFAVEEGKKYFVVEGNRRLCAVKLLLNPELRKQLGVELPDLRTLTDSELKALEQLPVFVAKNRKELWEYLALRHINGPSAWRSFSKAQFIASVHKNTGESLADIARKIGDRHSTVERLFDGLAVLEQAESLKVFDREDRYKSHLAFSHLFTALPYPNVRAYLGLGESRPKDLFKPVPSKKARELGNFMVWLFGSEKANKPPLVQSQNPDLRILEDTLGSKKGIAALERDLPLLVARDIGRGDSAVLRDSVLRAKDELQKARGVFLTGYTAGDVQMRKDIDDVFRLAQSLSDDVRQADSAKRVRA